jgi:hypothetical protein
MENTHAQLKTRFFFFFERHHVSQSQQREINYPFLLNLIFIDEQQKYCTLKIYQE